MRFYSGIPPPPRPPFHPSRRLAAFFPSRLTAAHEHHSKGPSTENGHGNYGTYSWWRWDASHVALIHPPHQESPKINPINLNDELLPLPYLLSGITASLCCTMYVGRLDDQKAACVGTQEEMSSHQWSTIMASEIACSVILRLISHDKAALIHCCMHHVHHHHHRPIHLQLLDGLGSAFDRRRGSAESLMVLVVIFVRSTLYSVPTTYLVILICIQLVLGAYMYVLRTE